MLPVDSTVTLVSQIVQNIYTAIAAITTIIGAVAALIGHHVGFKKGVKSVSDNKSGPA